MTKAEIKTALQALLDYQYGEGYFTVGDGVEFVAPADALTTEKLDGYHSAKTLLGQSVFFGTLQLTCIHETVPAELQITANPLMAQAENLWPAVIAANAYIPVSRSAVFTDLIFAYLDGKNYSGFFTGYKFEITTALALDESGYPSLGENGLPYVS